MAKAFQEVVEETVELAHKFNLDLTDYKGVLLYKERPKDNSLCPIMATNVKTKQVIGYIEALQECGELDIKRIFMHELQHIDLLNKCTWLTPIEISKVVPILKVFYQELFLLVNPLILPEKPNVMCTFGIPTLNKTWENWKNSASIDAYAQFISLAPYVISRLYLAYGKETYLIKLKKSVPNDLYLFIARVMGTVSMKVRINKEEDLLEMSNVFYQEYERRQRG